MKKLIPGVVNLASSFKYRTIGFPEIDYQKNPPEEFQSISSNIQ